MMHHSSGPHPRHDNHDRRSLLFTTVKGSSQSSLLYRLPCHPFLYALKALACAPSPQTSSFQMRLPRPFRNCGSMS